MTKIINLFGAPSAGKSYTAMALTCALKSKGYKAEYVSEYAKDLVIEGSEHKLKHQIYVFAKQLKRISVLEDKGLDFIVTDSPTLLSSFYGAKYNTTSPLFSQLVLESFTEQNNVNFYLSRDVTALPYDPNLRVQTEQEAKTVDQELKVFLQKLGVNCTPITSGLDTTVESIVKVLEGVKNPKEAQSELVANCIETAVAAFKPEIYRQIKKDISTDSYVRMMVPSIQFGRRFGHTTGISKYCQRNLDKKILVITNAYSELKELFHSSENIKISTSRYILRGAISKDTSAIIVDSQSVVDSLDLSLLVSMSLEFQIPLIFVGN